MTADMAADVLVVGAGPAGTVAAAALARRGTSVLLAGKDIRGGDHDVLVTGQARGLLSAAGLGGGLPLRPVTAFELRFGRSTTRAIADSGAAVCDWLTLRRALRDMATAAGAQYARGTVTAVHGGPSGYRALLVYGGRQVTLSARHVIVAAGGGSGTLVTSARPAVSGLVCARRYRGVRLGARAILLLPAPAPTSAHAELTCVWVLPGEDGTVTVGTALASGDRLVRPGDLHRQAMRELTETEPLFAALSPAGPLRSEPLYAGFRPEQVRDADCLLAGDGAGLVNPFTGEGLSCAVHTGLLAAQYTGFGQARPAAARRGYGRRVAATFAGCFATTRHASRRYHLTWRVLAAGAASDHPFYVKARRALLLPEGPSGLATAGRLDLSGPDAALLGPFLLACDEVAISVVRDQWPFLARLALAGQSLDQPRLRPATLLFAALSAAGREPPSACAPLGAAIELAFLGASSLFGTADHGKGGRGVDWGLAATLLAGDFLLAQASRLVATYTPELAWSFADWLAELAALRAGRLGPRPAVPAGAVYASLLEFPARAGALLGGSSPAGARSLRDFGHHCGHAFLHTEDILALSGRRTRLDTTLDVMLAERLSAVPDSAPGQPISRAELDRDAGLRARVLTTARTACEAARRSALHALGRDVTDGAAHLLRAFLAAVTEPVEEFLTDGGPAAGPVSSHALVSTHQGGAAR